MTIDPNADCKTREETVADDRHTYGRLNQHPKGPASFRVGCSVDQNRKSRRSMEDAHSFIYDFGGIQGQGYFAVFDGHAGKLCAEWCGEHFHEHLLEALVQSPATPIPDVLNATFHNVDKKLSELAAAGGTHSGCTVVTAFLRLEDEQGNPVGTAGGVGNSVVIAPPAASSASSSALDGPDSKLGDGDSTIPPPPPPPAVPEKDNNEVDGTTKAEAEEPSLKEKEGGVRAAITSKVKDVISGSASSSSVKAADAKQVGAEGGGVEVPCSQKGPAEAKKAAKRTLYTANAGDARAVLSRGGRAVRLTYDHKGSDAKEAKRITDAGGFVMNNRVNGVLAVTRSLGDSSMKEFVVGSPYTTETTLGPDDDFLIVACDGLWDVCQDQEAVDLIRGTKDPQEASKILLEHALSNFSSDNLSVIVVSLLPEQ